MRTGSIHTLNFFYDYVIFAIAEIYDYARRIGISPEKEPHLLTIAIEGLMQALPEEWKPWYEKYFIY